MKFPISYRHCYPHNKIMGNIELDESIVELITEKIKIEKKCKDAQIFGFSYIPSTNSIVPDVRLFYSENTKKDYSVKESTRLKKLHIDHLRVKKVNKVNGTIPDIKIIDEKI